MKDFSRKDLSFSLCGLNCILCPMHLGGYCPGCGGGAGNQPCAIARCSLQHEHVEYCYLCPEFPCSQFDGAENYDSFITHQRQLRDIKRVQEIGIEAYNQELTRKSEILHTLLAEYNDGRRKSFYCLAVNLLPLPKIETIMEELASDLPLNALPLKEKAAYVAALFENDASQERLVLKLRKKPSA
ncbi:MAG TPA: DUF3795 domain-containing protein [Anaerolineaceae bacterium]|nr:DUF3795 domain-containing protein [Anaerolineaceae bacterium]